MSCPRCTTPGGLTYEGIKNLRTNIVKCSVAVFDDVNGGHLKQIYGALSDDLNTSVGASGRRLRPARLRYQIRWTNSGDRREALAKIVGTSGDTAPEKVFDRLYGDGRHWVTRRHQQTCAGAQGDGERMTWNEVASSVAG